MTKKKNKKSRIIRNTAHQNTEKILKPRLPIEGKRKTILKNVKENQVVIIVGNTGCGKSTQIPQMLYDAGYAKDGIIACTQPRKIAAYSLATRVAAEMGCELGTLVGYKIRFEDVWNHETKILYLTDGSLVRACPRNLKLYSAIVLDEIHERSLQTDVLFGLLKKTLRERDDLRVILSSATVDAEQLSQYFNDAPIIGVEGTLFPIEIIYEPVAKNEYLNGVASIIKRINRKTENGDVLAFLPGKFEIERVTELLKSQTLIQVVPAHAELSGWEMKMIHKPAQDGYRKVVLSTNMSETSLTIEGIVYVVDTGYVKIIEHNGRTGVNHLRKVWCSRAEADQRKGRAGRTQDGVCYRLYSEDTFVKEMPEIPPPEVKRLDLTSMVLQLKDIGYLKVSDFDFIDEPNAYNVKAAHDNLHRLEALNDDCKLTHKGQQMAAFPLEPHLSAALIRASELGCAEEVIKICAVMSAITGTNVQKLSPVVRSKELPFHTNPYSPRLGDFINEFGDIIALRNVLDEFMKYRYAPITQQDWCDDEGLNRLKLIEATFVFMELKDTMERLDLPVETWNHNLEEIADSFLEGAFYNLAESKDGSFKLMRNGEPTGTQHPFLRYDSKSGKIFGEDLIRRGNDHRTVLTCVTRVPEDTDLSDYMRRMKLTCQHVSWPVKEKEPESQEKKSVGNKTSKKNKKPPQKKPLSPKWQFELL